MPRSYTVSRSTTIAATAERILPLIDTFPEWQRWSPFESSDPALVRDYRGPASGVGAVYEWSGNAQAGAGVMTITESGAEGVAIDLQFLRPFKSESRHRFELAAVEEGTRVSWTMDGEYRSVMGVISRLFFPMEKFMGAEFDKGLASLREVAESPAV